jgi:predicted extracellular nuclease
VKVNNGSLQFISGDWIGNSRADLEKGYDSLSVDYKGKHDVLVCAMNLEYYLVESFGTGYGPDDASDHAKQRAKVSKALAKINADLYGLVEIEQGQSALREIAQDLTRNTGRPFAFVNDGGSANGSYTKAGYVYCSDVIEPKGTLRVNNTGVRNRKYMQLFEHKQSGERFIYSINHFKAKSGSGSGGDADQGDGQGSYNAARVKEAASVLTQYRNNRTLYQENDILIMGDLNAYGKEDPIRLLVDSGMTDLHRYFHADSSYSYTYRNEAGYLDHALCNSTLLPQVTGMVAYHINSDELDQYTYDKSNDQTMFRSSDHDPVLVGLKLSAVSTLTPVINTMDVLLNRSNICIKNATGGYVRIYSINGNLIAQKKIDSDLFTVQTGTLPCGMYIIHLFHNQQLKRVKMLVQ